MLVHKCVRMVVHHNTSSTNAAWLVAVVQGHAGLAVKAEVSRCNTTFGDHSFAAAAPQVWHCTGFYFIWGPTYAKRLRSHLISWAAVPLTFKWSPSPLNELLLLLLFLVPHASPIPRARNEKLMQKIKVRSRHYYYYAALLPRRGPHIASHSVCPSVCLSVCPSVPCADVLCLHLHRLTSEHPK